MKSSHGAIAVARLKQSETQVILRRGVLWLQPEQFAKSNGSIGGISSTLQRLTKKIENFGLRRLKLQRGLECGDGVRKIAEFAASSAKVTKGEAIFWIELRCLPQMVFGRSELFFLELQDSKMEVGGGEARIQPKRFLKFGGGG